MRIRHIVVGASGLALVLGACGGGDGGGAQASEEYLDALTESIMSTDEGDEPLTADEDEARCAAERMAEEIGQERLEDAGMTIEALGESDPFADGTDLTEEESLQVVDAMFECVDVGAAMAGSFAADAEIPPDAAGCLGDRFEESEEFRDFFALTLREGDDAAPSPDVAERFTDALFDCVDFGEIFAAGLGAELTDDEIACLDDAIRDSDDFRELMAAEIAGDGGSGDVPPEVFDLVFECVPPSKLGGITGS